jgi:hypothetical protein
VELLENCGILNNQYLRRSYSLTNIICVMKSMIIKCAEQAARTEMRNACKIFTRKHEGKMLLLRH